MMLMRSEWTEPDQTSDEDDNTQSDGDEHNETISSDGQAGRGNHDLLIKINDIVPVPFFSATAPRCLLSDLSCLGLKIVLFMSFLANKSNALVCEEDED